MGDVLHTRKRERSRTASEARWGGGAVGGGGGTESQKEGAEGRAKERGTENGKPQGQGYVISARKVE